MVESSFITMLCIRIYVPQNYILYSFGLFAHAWTADLAERVCKYDHKISNARSPPFELVQAAVRLDISQIISFFPQQCLRLGVLDHFLI